MWEETETLGGPGELTQTEVGLMTIGRALCSSAILLYPVAKVMEALERIPKDTGSNLVCRDDGISSSQSACQLSKFY